MIIALTFLFSTLFGFCFGWYLRSSTYRRAKLPEISRLIEVIGEGINVGQSDPDASNPYERGNSATDNQSVEYQGFEMGMHAGKLFHENMRAFEVGKRFEAAILAGWRGEANKPAVSWLRECYDTGYALRHGKLK